MALCLKKFECKNLFTFTLPTLSSPERVDVADNHGGEEGVVQGGGPVGDPNLDGGRGVVGDGELREPDEKARESKDDESPEDLLPDALVPLAQEPPAVEGSLATEVVEAVQNLLSCLACWPPLGSIIHTPLGNTLLPS